jgi:hypothetical protein
MVRDAPDCAPKKNAIGGLTPSRTIRGLEAFFFQKFLHNQTSNGMNAHDMAFAPFQTFNDSETI